MKVITTALFVCAVLAVNAQLLGVLRVQSFTNGTNDLSDNEQEDSTLVRIIHDYYKLDTTIWFTSVNNFKALLEPSNYKLICSVGNREIEFQNVRIFDAKITFIDLLFEPEKKLNFFDRRKRKKLFYNYE